MIVAGARGVNRFRKPNAMRFVRLEVKDLNLLQTVFPFREHCVIGEQIDAVDLHGRPVSHEFLPVFLGWLGDRRGHHSKILGAFIRANVKEISAVGHVILMIGLAWNDCFPFGVGIAGRDVSRLSRRLAERFQHDDGIVSRSARPDVE